MSKTDIAIGIPTGGFIKSQTVESILNIVKYFDADVFIENSSLVHYNREMIVEKTKGRGYTHLLFVDSDMVFNHLDLDELLRADKDIVSAVCNLRKFPLIHTVRMLGDDGEIVIPEKLPTERFKCHSVGTGCMLIKTEVFEKLKKPYFAFSPIENQSMSMGEDVWFCNKAREAGFDIWVEPSVMVGHIGDFIY